MIQEQRMPLTKYREPVVERTADTILDFPDYRAVISQIKREVLIEINSYSSGQPVPIQQRPERIHPGVGLAETLLALLIFPSTRRRLEQILRQTALEGLELLEKTRSSITALLGEEL